MAEDAKKSADASVEQNGWAENEKLKKPAESTDDEIQEVVDDAEVVKKTKSEGDEPDTKAEDVTKSDDDSHDSDAKEDDDGDRDNTDDSNNDKKDNDEKSEKNRDESGTSDDENDEESKIEIEIELPNETAAKEKADNSGDFQASVREQIENCKFEIISELQESIHHECADVMQKELRKVERRRRIGAWVRDVIILVLAALVGYFGYCLYDAQYFDFMKQDCKITNTCGGDSDVNIPAQVANEPTKDTEWYRQNYGFLFDSLRINLNADQVSAYYLYSDDYRANEIPANYSLAMAYNRLTSNVTYDSEKGIMVPAEDLHAAFIRLFGDTGEFVKQDFVYDCAEFKYDKTSDSFITPSMQCNSSSNRVIMEEIDEIYEEGSAMYFLTSASIYDRAETSFYSFDNLFKPIAKHATKDDFDKYKSLMNKYQYQFKKNGDEYIFSGVVKLK